MLLRCTHCVVDTLDLEMHNINRGYLLSIVLHVKANGEDTTPQIGTYPLQLQLRLGSPILASRHSKNSPDSKPLYTQGLWSLPLWSLVRLLRVPFEPPTRK